MITSWAFLEWGGPPGPRPTPSSASSRCEDTDFMGTKRVQVDSLGPGGPHHSLKRALAFYQVEMPVGTPHQHRHPIGLGIAIDHVVLRNFHFEHRLFQGHGFVPVAIVHTKDLLISTLSSGERNLFACLSVSRWRAVRLGCQSIYGP